jgi:hypothetical protein
MVNAWIKHLMDFQKSNPQLSYTECMTKAKPSYHANKSKTGGSLTARETQSLIKASYDKNIADVGDYKIDKSLSGNRTKVYFDENTGKSIVTHKGTDSIQDVGTDIGLAVGFRGKRFDHAKKMQKKAEKKYGTENMETLGHSLGGIVAEEVGTNSRNVVTLNKAVTPFGLAKKNRNKNQYDIKTEHDPVSMLNKFATNKNKTTVIKSKSFNPLSEHSSDTMSRVKSSKVFGRGGNRRK